ncbi:MAG: glycosyltransferase [Leptospiraceae bacterium]|nr:glycosyltransferase [Leptospiraceae bacterium]MCK6381202.1 glycosyltransferase [Leptospiraceae bacterium]NUM42245.1 glycosyltransferase [Leptospiraceae bacterium]
MKVAVIHDWLTGMRGGEKVLESILKIFPNSELFTLFYSKGSLSPLIENRKIHTAFTDKLPFKKSKYRNYLPLFPTAIETFDLRGFDLILSSSHCVAKGIISPPDSTHISYIHSPMRYVWDMYYEYFPKKSGIKNFLIQFISNYLRIWDVTSAQRVDKYVCNSKFVAKRVKKYYSKDSNVIYPPCLETGTKIINEKKEDYYLIVSAFAPYKRIDLAIESFRINGKKLVIIGSGQDEGILKKSAPKNITFLSGVSKTEIEEYYKRARGFIFPGLEDFGITPVEAQKFCTPVIAYGKGGVLETVNDKKTGVFFQNQNIGDLNEAIMVSEKIRYNPEDFQKNIERFTEEKFIIEMKNTVDEVLRGNISFDRSPQVKQKRSSNKR